MMTSRREFISRTIAGMMVPGLINAQPYQPDSTEHAQASAMKVNAFSKHFHWLGYEEMASVVADLGFDGIDLTVRPNGHVTPENVGADLAKAVNAIRKRGLQVDMITTSITNANEPYTEQIIRAAAELGIKFYRMGWISYEPDKSIPENIEAFKKRFEELASLNEKHQIHGGYQNHSGTSLGSSVWDLWLVLEDLDPRFIGCQYDIHHATIEGANSWPIGMHLLKRHIKTIDIKDFRWAQSNGTWKIEGKPLGEGMVNFSDFFVALKDLGLQCPVSMHFEYPLGGAESGKKKLSIPTSQLIAAMAKDLKTLKGWI